MSTNKTVEMNKRKSIAYFAAVIGFPNLSKRLHHYARCLYWIVSTWYSQEMEKISHHNHVADRHLTHTSALNKWMPNLPVTIILFPFFFYLKFQALLLGYVLHNCIYLARVSFNSGLIERGDHWDNYSIHEKKILLGMSMSAILALAMA